MKNIKQLKNSIKNIIKFSDVSSKQNEIITESVNYHFTRKCNYSCGFCFHTAKNSHVLDINEAKRGITLLKNYGLRKLNFAGGEPLLPIYREFVGELLRFCKEELDLYSCSIVSNGSTVNEKWFEKYGRYIDYLAISLDS